MHFRLWNSNVDSILTIISFCGFLKYQDTLTGLCFLINLAVTLFYFKYNPNG